MSRSAVRVRSSALLFACKTHENEKPPMLVSGALSVTLCDRVHTAAVSGSILSMVDEMLEAQAQ